MFVFAYSKNWADLVVAQLAARHPAVDPQDWSYACLCIGRKFDEVLEHHYLEIDQILGPHLHVFSLFPPPQNFISQRYKALRPRQDEAGKRAEAIYEQLLTVDGSYSIDRHRMIEEKVKLLSDLRSAGLSVDQKADFLFFAFHGTGEEVDIDVIAAATAPISDTDGPEAFLDFFDRMAKVAEKHYKADHDVQAFVRALSFRWAIKIDIRKAQGLYGYIQRFINVVKGKPE
jgi:hypothetical protein